MQTDVDTARAATLDTVSSAGDLLAECLGNVLVQSEEDELTEERADAARQMILDWHVLRAHYAPRRTRSPV